MIAPMGNPCRLRQGGCQDGSYCVVDAWHGTCYTHREECEPWSWSCWQESCVRAWAELHAGCYIEVIQGMP